jgi:hypothetical protein
MAVVAVVSPRPVVPARSEPAPVLTRAILDVVLARSFSGSIHLAANYIHHSSVHCTHHKKVVDNNLRQSLDQHSCKEVALK